MNTTLARIALAGALLVSGESTRAAALPADTFARVGNETISMADYEMAFRTAARSKFYHGNAPEAEIAKLQREVGDRVVNDVLLAKEAARRGIPLSALFVLWFLTGIAMMYVGGMPELDAKARLPWAGNTMSARSFTTARLMEAWSHGLDAIDAAGKEHRDSDRLWQTAQIGIMTREFAYRTRGMEPNREPLRVELDAPSGARWTWGPEDASLRITGYAGDFCRVVTQRINYLDTDLKTQGEGAEEFLRIAQAFAGPPGPGRQPKRPRK